VRLDAARSLHHLLQLRLPELPDRGGAALVVGRVQDDLHPAIAIEIEHATHLVNIGRIVFRVLRVELAFDHLGDDLALHYTTQGDERIASCRGCHGGAAFLRRRVACAGEQRLIFTIAVEVHAE
jgi:hypothetical protein